MIVFNHEWLNRVIRLIAIPELIEDPNDFLMKRLIILGQNLSISSQHSVAVFVFFIVYEIYSYMHSQSALMLLIVVIDVAIVSLIILEYKRMKAE